MTAIKLNKCKTVNEFADFLGSLDAAIGKLGGRHFVSQNKKQSYSMNQIVLQFKKIVEEQKPGSNEILQGCDAIKKLEEAQLFEALMKSDDKSISKIRRVMTKIRQTIGNFIFSVTHRRFDRKKVLDTLDPGKASATQNSTGSKPAVIDDKNVHTDKNKLIKGNRPIDATNFSYLLNLGLLRMAEENASTDEEKAQIRFLASNFLTKSAPVQVQCWRPFLKKIDPKFEKMFETMYQVGGFEDYWYHRESVNDKTITGDQYNKKLAFGLDSPFILTDTLDFTHLFPLKWIVLKDDTSSSNKNVSSMKKVLNDHFSQGIDKGLDSNLKTPFIFDLTDRLGKRMQVDGDDKKEKELKREFSSFKNEFENSIDQTVNELIQANPSLAQQKDKIKKFILNNTTCISRVNMGNINGIKVLPINSLSKKDATSHLMEFVQLTGIYAGAITIRRQALDAFGRREDIRYGVPTNNKNAEVTPYYPKKEDFTGTRIFKRMSTLFNSADDLARNSVTPSFTDAEIKALGIPKDNLTSRIKDLTLKPHLIVLGKATMNLLDGLMSEITSEKWNELNKNPALGQVVQTSLVMIKEHLANAEMQAIAGNFPKFSQEIELVHAEIATLLELTHPFKESDFEMVYRKNVDSMIPEEFKSTCKVGLGKTAMNIFAGINTAVMEENPPPHRIYGNNIYFEELAIIGDNLYFDNYLKNPNAPPIDLYVAQFNPNVNTNRSLTEYTLEDVGANIKYLLDNNRAAKHLTVAIDTTIEKSPSENVKKILEQYKDEIKDGKINFVIFNSGQKFDMLGMDNYYGCPFYTVNNGGPEWKSFDSLFTQPVHKVDQLSTQWFTLSNKYAASSLAQYKNLIFKNTRYILDHIPKALQPNNTPNQTVKVNRANKNIDVCFIDLKVQGKNYVDRSFKFMEFFYEKMHRAGIKAFSRQSFGFYHPCLLVFDLPAELKSGTTRLTPGINPEENEAIIDFFSSIPQTSAYNDQ
jgi:hypothetical protein